LTKENFRAFIIIYLKSVCIHRSNGPDRCLQSILSATAQCTSLSAAHGIFSKIDPTLGHKACFNKYKKKIEIIPCILSDNNAKKKKNLELNNKRNNRKYSNTWRLNTTLLHD
jgi:hypothetical protein